MNVSTSAFINYVNTMITKSNANLSVYTGTITGVYPDHYVIKPDNSNNTIFAYKDPSVAEVYSNEDTIYYLKALPRTLGTKEIVYILGRRNSSTKDWVNNLPEFLEQESIEWEGNYLTEEISTAGAENEEDFFKYLNANQWIEFSTKIKLPEEPHNITSYSIDIVLSGESNGDVKSKTLVFNDTDVNGYPFKQGGKAEQKKLFKLFQIEDEPFECSKITINNNNENITLIEPKLTTGSLADTLKFLTVEISSRGDKTFLSKEDASSGKTVTLDAVVKYNNSVISNDELKYYWFIKDESEEKVHPLIGEGWKCLNKLTESTALKSDGDEEASKEYEANNSFIELNNSTLSGFSNMIKCIVFYRDFPKESNEAIIYNYNRKKLFLDISIAPEGSKDYIVNADNTVTLLNPNSYITLIAKLKGENSLIAVPSVIKYDWTLNGSSLGGGGGGDGGGTGEGDSGGDDSGGDDTGGGSGTGGDDSGDTGDSGGDDSGDSGNTGGDDSGGDNTGGGGTGGDGSGGTGGDNTDETEGRPTILTMNVSDMSVNPNIDVYTTIFDIKNGRWYLYNPDSKGLFSSDDLEKDLYDADNGVKGYFTTDTVGYAFEDVIYYLGSKLDEEATNSETFSTQAGTDYPFYSIKWPSCCFRDKVQDPSDADVSDIFVFGMSSDTWDYIDLINNDTDRREYPIVCIDEIVYYSPNASLPSEYQGVDVYKLFYYDKDTGTYVAIAPGNSVFEHSYYYYNSKEPCSLTIDDETGDYVVSSSEESTVLIGEIYSSAVTVSTTESNPEIRKIAYGDIGGGNMKIVACTVKDDNNHEETGTITVIAAASGGEFTGGTVSGDTTFTGKVSIGADGSFNYYGNSIFYVGKRETAGDNPGVIFNNHSDEKDFLLPVFRYGAYFGGNDTTQESTSSLQGVVFDKNLNHGVTINCNLTTADSSSTGSDRNKKYDIDNQTEAYSKVFDKLNPVTFKYKKDSADAKIHTGFIAQEVEQAIIDAGLENEDLALVTYKTEEDGTKYDYGLRYSEFISMCVYEIQKNKQKIAELEEKINELKGEN